MLEFHPLSLLFPLVTGTEFEALVEDIRRNGVQEPVVLHDGKILDGRNRCRAAEAAGCPYPTKPYDGVDPLGYVVSANIHRRHLNETQRAVLALNIERHEAEAAAQRMLAGKRNPEEPVPQGAAALQGRARDRAGAAVGVSGRTISVVKAVAKAAPELVPAMTEGTLLAKQALREVNARKGDERRAANAAKVATTPPLEVLASGGKFSTIVADPPWSYENEGLFGRGKPPYIVMPDSEIKALPVGRLADEECHLYLWATNASLLRAFYVLEAWGFRYATTITWCKTTKSLEKPRYGMGYYFRGATEHMLFGVKGSMRLKRFDCPTWFQAAGGPDGHSSKPEEAFQLDRVVLARPLSGTVRASCTSLVGRHGVPRS